MKAQRDDLVGVGLDERTDAPFGEGKRYRAKATRQELQSRSRPLAIFLASLVIFLFAFLGRLSVLAPGFGILFALFVTSAFSRSMAYASFKWNWLQRRIAEASMAAPMLAWVSIYWGTLAGLCIEGGITFGFPHSFYSECYGPSGGGPPIVEFRPIALLIDAVFWYTLAAAIVAWVAPFLSRLLRKP